MGDFRFTIPFSMEDDFLFFSGELTDDGLTGFSIVNEPGDRANFYLTDTTENDLFSLTGQPQFEQGDIKSFRSGAIIRSLDEDGNPDPLGEVEGISVDIRVFNIEVDVDDFTETLASGDPLNTWAVIAADDDNITGSLGDDELFGFSGSDVLDGGAGNDALIGGSGSDTVLGGEGDDLLRGGSGDDRIEGGLGIDTIRGNNGDDTIKAGASADIVTAGKGDDRLFGNGGEDTLVGGKGDDKLVGGGGADIFVFGQNSGDDTIVRFKQGVDLIQINGSDGFADLDIVADGADVVVSFGNASVTLTNEDVANFTADDFLF